jgi:hypothetical protein
MRSLQGVMPNRAIGVLVLLPSRFLSRFRSEKGYGEGITQGETGSYGRPQTL